MPLSYSRAVIKSDASIKEGSKVIKTQEKVKSPAKKIKEEPLKTYEVENYVRLGESILKKAKESSNEILMNAYSEAETIKKIAYEKGYGEGEKNGYEDGYKEAYEANLEKARKIAEGIIKESENLLLTAKSVYEEYLCSKESEIVNLSLVIAQNLLRERLTQESGLNNLVKEAIEASRNIKTLIIKANSFHCDALEKDIHGCKQISLKVEVFIIPDNTMEPGNVEIITDKGKVKTGIQTIIEKINETF